MAAVALNPTLIQTYSIAATQGMGACMVVWTMVLTLGEGRPLWQISLGATLAGLTLMTRENLVPMLPLLLFYIFWQHGVKAGIWATLSGVVTVGIIHAIYWPNILSVWDGWIPEAVTPFLNPWRGYYWGGTPVWHPDMPFQSRWLSFLQALRLNFIPLVGVAGFGVLIFKGSQWNSRANYRAATFSPVFIILSYNEKCCVSRSTQICGRIMKLTYRTHALLRMFHRKVSADEIRQVCMTRATIEDYPEDKPYPSRLILGWRKQGPLHVVLAENKTDDEMIIITVYEPDPAKWSADFRRRLT